MNTLYTRRLFGTFVIICLFLGLFMNELGVFVFGDNILLYYLIAFFITAFVVHWVSAAAEVSRGSHQRVEKVLRTLNDSDLDLLRSRLAESDQADSDDYSSMAELMQSGKRKNEAR